MKIYDNRYIIDFVIIIGRYSDKRYRRTPARMNHFDNPHHAV